MKKHFLFHTLREEGKGLEGVFQVPVKGDHIGRNGRFEISNVAFFLYSNMVSLVGLSKKKGIILHGGFHKMPIEHMDMIAISWLRYRGKLKSTWTFTETK